MWPMNKKVKLQQAEETRRSNIETIANRKATKEVVEQTKEEIDKLYELFQKNHFTIKIFLAAGGKKGNK